jgi:hypothetical protein
MTYSHSVDRSLDDGRYMICHRTKRARNLSGWKCRLRSDDHFRQLEHLAEVEEFLLQVCPGSDLVLIVSIAVFGEDHLLNRLS